MGKHTAAIAWERGAAAFTDNRYSRAHAWRFDGGTEVRASSSPQVVPVPMSDASAVDPEEAFVASIASCHMLWFLSLAASAGFCVDRYEDEAEGAMGRDTQGRTAITRVTLRPAVAFSGDRRPNREELERLHHEAHERCFIANSVRTGIAIEPR